MDVQGSERGTYGEMASRTEIFDDSGPIHLRSVDWTNIHHQRTVAASLVQGVYILQLDHEHKRQGKEAHAPRWWMFFNFILCQPIYDADGSICGAIFESNRSAFTSGAPRYVIAFRGTGKGEAFPQDFKLDIQVIKNGLHKSPRFQQAIKVVRDSANAAGGSKIWLAGHSLGAAIATLTGKNMVKNGIYIEAFLFNSPFIWAPTEWIKSKTLNNGIRIAKSFITAGLTVAMKKSHSQASGSNNSFAAVSAWVPNLFLNPADWISSGYIEYFEHSKYMKEMGAERIEKLAIQNSARVLVSNVFRREPEDSEPLQFLPSANLTINQSRSQTFISSHGISQWWKPKLHLQSKDNDDEEINIIMCRHSAISLPGFDGAQNPHES